MAGDILDFISNNWQQLTGMGEAQAAPSPPPPQTPPPAAMANAAPSFAPGSTVGGPGQMTPTAGIQNPVPAFSPGAMPQPPIAPPSGAPVNPAAAAGQPNADAAPDWMKTAGPVSAGLPFSTPPQTAATGSPLPPPDAGGSQPVGTGDFGGAARPAPMPPPSSAPPATSSGGGGLAGALGLNKDSWRSALAGAGSGFARVGALPSGASRGRSIATGLGGGLQGNIGEQEKQEALKTKAENDRFAQSSTAFKDMLAARSADDTASLRAAQSKLALSRAQALMTAAGGNAASKAWMNTPDGKVMYAEGYIQKFRDQQRKIAEKNAQQTGQPVDEDKINKDTDAYRKQLYQDWKIDPSQAKKSGTGETKDSPVSTKNMPQEVFDAVVPMGAWYTDQNGAVRMRTKPPAPSEGQAAGAALANDNAMAQTGGSVGTE